VSKDQVVGALLMLGSVAGIVVYLWGIFVAEQWVQELFLRLTGAVAVGGVLGILAWIGYTLATTPPPKPIEEIEKELEEELKKIEAETEQETQEKPQTQEKTEKTGEEQES